MSCTWICIFIHWPSASPPPCPGQPLAISFLCWALRTSTSNVLNQMCRVPYSANRIDYRMKWKIGRHAHQISKTLLGLPIPPWASSPSWAVLCTQNQPKYNEKQDEMLANFQKNTSVDVWLCFPLEGTFLSIFEINRTQHRRKMVSWWSPWHHFDPRDAQSSPRLEKSRKSDLLDPP